MRRFWRRRRCLLSRTASPRFWPKQRATKESAVTNRADGQRANLGIPGNTEDFLRIPGTSKEVVVIPKTSQEFLGLPRTSLDFLGPPRNFLGSGSHRNS